MLSGRSIKTSIVLSSVAVSASISGSLPVFAEDAVEGSRTLIESQTVKESAPSSSEETVKTQGVGFRQSNKFVPKYKARLKNWEEQIQLGLSKGWLGEKDAVSLRAKLAELKDVETDVSSKGYPKAELDDMEKQFTQFNKDLSDAGTRQARPAGIVSEGEKSESASPPAAPAKEKRAPAKVAPRAKSPAKKAFKKQK